MAQLDATHDPRRRSWVTSAEGHRDFPIQNLPLGVFSPPGATDRRAGVAIGDMIFDLGAALELDLFARDARHAAEAASSGSLNELFALGAAPRQALRARLSEILDANGSERSRAEGLHARLLHPAASCVVHLPAASATTRTSMSASTTRRTSARFSAPTTRCFRTISTFRSATTAEPRLSSHQARRSGGLAGSSSLRMRLTQVLARASASTMSWSSASGSGTGNALGEAIPIGEAANTSPAFACSTTGRPGISRLGSTSLSGPSCPRTSAPRYHRGWSRPKRWRRFAFRSRSVRRAIRNRCRTYSTKPTSGKARSTSSWRSCS